MQVKANGITFNYQVDGAEGAPWLVFSNSLTMQCGDVGRAGEGAGALVPHPAL